VFIELLINGEPQEWDVPANEPLLDALRRQGYTGAKRVCESGECGACAVIVDGLAVDSCLMLAVQAAGSDVVTVEGLEGADLHPVQEAFTENGSIQCGFCIPGMIVTAANYLDENARPTEEEIRHVLVGNLCRCTGYKKPVEAVLKAARAGVES
jgi:aerobic-type carbon monoxide dehydrogenase small subunit (CoxS/CutS family)